MDLSKIDFKTLGEELHVSIGPRTSGGGFPADCLTMTDILKKHSIKVEEWETVKKILVGLGFYRCDWVRYGKFNIWSQTETTPLHDTGERIMTLPIKRPT